MDKKIEICNETQHINIEAVQEWIPTKDYLPLNSWIIGGEIELKGHYYYSFLCIVERPFKPDDNYVLMASRDRHKNINRTVELCYWNAGAMKFQDRNNEWVDVTHWTQIPKIPIPNIITITREEMLEKIEKGVFKKICHINDQDEYKDSTLDFAFSGISLNEEIWYSTGKNDDEIEDYMYCILNLE